MAGFYAIILDWHYTGGGATLELIESGASQSELEALDQYDPAADVSRVVRSKFATNRVKPHPIRNCHTNNLNPAHICHLVAR